MKPQSMGYKPYPVGKITNELVNPIPTTLEAPPRRWKAETHGIPLQATCPCCGEYVTDRTAIDRILSHEIDVARLKIMLERAVNAWVMTKDRGRK